MIDELLCTVGIPVYVVSKYGIKTKTSLKVDKKSAAPHPVLQWRVQPMLSCEFSYIAMISAPDHTDSGCQISFLLHDYKLTVEMDDHANATLADEVHACLIAYQQQSKAVIKSEKDANMIKGSSQVHSSYQQTLTLRKAVSDAAQKEEQLIQLCFYLRYKEAYILVEKVRNRYLNEWKNSAFSHWVRVVKDVNMSKMEKDRHRWRLHATANQEIDLQAWYHALFYLEVNEHAIGANCLIL